MTEQQLGAARLMRRWDLRRGDLDAAADVLGVDRLSLTEWAPDLGHP